MDTEHAHFCGLNLLAAVSKPDQDLQPWHAQRDAQCCGCLLTWCRCMQVRVEGEGLRTVELSLKDLQTRFKKHTITATLQCTGNRRDDLNTVKPVKGLEWSVGAPASA